MSSTTLDSVPSFDVTDPAFSITSDEVHEAREKSWYATTPYGLAVLRYEQVNRLIKHPKLRQGSAAWPAHNGVTEGPFAEWFASWILNKEGEEHHRLRRLMNPAFSPKLIGSLVPRFQALANELIDNFAEPDRCEFVSEFAEPYAARVIAIMLGLPEEEWKVISTESATIGLALGVTLREDLPKIEAAVQRLYEYSDELIADRRANPRDDFMTTLVNASRPDDGRLSDKELRDAILLLIFGGFDTTRNQLGLAMQTFMKHPDQWRLLGERPDLGGKAVEEVMRVNPTVRWVTREVVEDFEYEGVTLKAGTTVHLYSESAGTDPRVFEPGFDITAERKPHFGFGGGVHHCLGHFVARSDMSEALPLLARRLRDPHELPGATWLPDSGNTGPNTLPIGFTPAP
ncbi:cytochrome P450 [Mycolicibacterium smegmatis]|uniref:Cytochrome P450 n=3 Tax=Mycolicibacterium smegmatis TaxID=1772 RepID=I7GG22_MYCS2|nr:cytochrome P450 [Mycolicibacterium smegmatis]AAD28344.1 cytochrome P450 [Mycolicibacterium smegmatis MC2 155]ABK70871.1 cytochrome P450 [Mycolicibacterium smegmatis MC2 155]AFP42941.1 Cytochrome P450 [Mycolicibacterium smegmatis MC2 155]AIU11664.1 cytochrome P450 [Mycolicibacterium smegmatis MC2 155]AIU18289.1 cytochrome P450 [Mycolicibacterium smegmatis]